MVMCSKCHKRVAVVFATKLENGNKVSEGLCLKCARELGIPVDNMFGNVMNQLGITPDQLENMENDMSDFIDGMGNLPAENEEMEEGGAPAIDMPKLFKEAGFPAEPGKAPSSKKKNDSREKQSKYKYLDTYCRNLTKRAADGKLDRIVGREKELDRVIQILCRRQKNNPCLIGEP